MKDKNYTPLNQQISLSKETEPILQKETKYQETEGHEPKPEVSTYIQKRAETIDLPPDLKKLGVQASPPVQNIGFQNVKTPLADDRVISGIHAPITSSLRWLATLALYILKQAHISLKVVGGHVVRVLKK